VEAAPPAAAPPPPPPPARFTQAEWDSFVSGYTSQYEEHAFFVDGAAVEGTIPAELRGTLLRNGPALYEIGGKRIPQPFDGDGMVAQFCFPGGGRPPFFANRFVRTQGALSVAALLPPRCCCCAPGPTKPAAKHVFFFCRAATMMPPCSLPLAQPLSRSRRRAR
jgi:hypothetical protein